MAGAAADESERRASLPKDALAGEEEEDAGEGSGADWSDGVKVAGDAAAGALGAADAHVVTSDDAHVVASDAHVVTSDALGRVGLAAEGTGAGAAAGMMWRDGFKDLAYDGTTGTMEGALDVRRLPLPLLLPPLEDDDEVAEGASLPLFPVELVALILLALISESPAPDAVAAPETSALLMADDGAAVPEFSFAAAASFAPFCCSHEFSSSSRVSDLFLGCMSAG